MERMVELGSFFAAFLCLGLAFPVCAWGMDRWDDRRRVLGAIGLGGGLLLGLEAIVGPMLGLDLWSLYRLL